MRKIYKYELQITDGPQVFKVPAGSSFLCVAAQKNMPVMWMLVDTEEHHVDQIVIQLVGTGNPIENPDVVADGYVGTIQLYEGALVLHAFVV